MAGSNDATSSEKKALLDTPADPPPSYTPSATSPTQHQRVPSGSQTALPIRNPSLRRPLPPLDLPFLTPLRSSRVILASASPRRLQLLSQLGLRPPALEVIPSTEPENFPKTLSPFEYVAATATQKAMTVYKQEINNEEHGEPALIIAADTVVVSSLGEILEKPRSEADHLRMLKQLRDTGAHRVYTAISIMAPLESARDPGYALETQVVDTAVKFDADLSDDTILAYVRTREGADKAGGYGIQGTGSILVDKVEGDYNNVVGLPLRATLKLIELVMTKKQDDEMLEGENEDGLGPDRLSDEE
ncbi:putative acetylserotonin methytransferase-like protein [Phaeomoniella chlamydospora]|uniref:Putative acetylserotonin methytransferase-like protein n=1 Tax=Phaeomoniella chlamydospora TaxID=158046 RepID=A0A0G2ETY1_PHACM|nr:putative acetylserotonin methytransferase-like protein [Phaeomoniella chlamydospora]